MDTGSQTFAAELADLVASTRALLEWHIELGADGLPKDDAPRSVTVDQHQASPPTTATKPLIDQREPRGEQRPSLGYAPPEPPKPMLAREPLQAFEPQAAKVQAPLFGDSIAPVLPIVSAPEQPSPMTLEERQARLALVAEQVRGCQKCVLHEQRKQTVFARGNPMSEIVFVGEGPGAEEDLQGLPFVGPAGQLLDRMIVAMGYHRHEVYICNIVKCRPPQNRKPLPQEMSTCSPYVATQLSIIHPKVIVALGATAVQGLLGTSIGIMKLRGTWKLYKGIPVMPTFHPAYLLREPSAKRDVWNDLKEVMRQLGKPVPEKG